MLKLCNIDVADKNITAFGEMAREFYESGTDRIKRFAIYFIRRI